MTSRLTRPPAAIAYSIISPIINGLACFAFFLLYFAYKYLFTWVYEQKCVPSVAPSSPQDCRR